MIYGYRKIRYHTVYSWHNRVDEYDLLHPNNVTKSDYDAMVWLKDNSPNDSLVAADRFLMSDINSSFIISAFTERRVYLEGFRFTLNSPLVDRDEVSRRFEIMKYTMDNDKDALNKLRKESVSYLIRTKWLYPDFECPEDIGYLVFENDSMSIYYLHPYS